MIGINLYKGDKYEKRKIAIRKKGLHTRLFDE